MILIGSLGNQQLNEVKFEKASAEPDLKLEEEKGK